MKRFCTNTICIGLLALLSTLGSGCSLAGLFYKNHYRSERFVLYTDHEPEFLSQIAPRVEKIYDGYQRIFQVPARELGRTSIFLKGDPRDQEVVDLGYSPNLLGYYIPFLKMISVDTKPIWTQEEGMLDQILLHEISHQFIVHCFPEATSQCWLNEGLASNFEVSLVEGDRFEPHMLNPVLLGIARRAVLGGHPAATLKGLLDRGWSEFHHGKDKDLDYALSWAIVYFLLHHYLPAEQSLPERIRGLWRIDPEEIRRLEPEFQEFLLGFDLTGKLIRLAHAPPESPLGKLTPRWAIRMLGDLNFLDDSRALIALEGLLDAEDPILAAHACFAFLTVLARNSDAARRCPAFRRGRTWIVKLLLNPAQPQPLREAVAYSVAQLPRMDHWWIPVLIRLLEAPEGELRVAAARGLSEALVKPTVVNPTFWRNGKLALRTAEVEEWRDWWISRSPGAD